MLFHAFEVSTRSVGVVDSEEGMTLQSVGEFDSAGLTPPGENRVWLHCMEVGYHTARDSRARWIDRRRGCEGALAKTGGGRVL